MRLEDVTAEIRPRAPWESIDLGCALARRHIGAIWKSWLVTVVPLWILLALVLINHPLWFIVITWWLKPIYDRVPLLVVSRALFGAVPTTKEVFKAWPRLMVRRWWFALLVGRFSPARGLSMPVSELEGLRGAEYRQRVSLLTRNGGEGATMATLAGLLLELVAGIGMVMLVFLMLPANIGEQWWLGVEEFFQYSEISEITPGLLWAIAVVRLLSFTLMEPFYVSAGFALYINSRTLTEGWDIELAFKRLGARLVSMSKQAGVRLVLLTGLCMGLVMTMPAASAQSEDPSKEQVKELLKHEDFTIHHRIEKVPIDEPKTSDGKYNFGIPALFAKLLFWAILTAVVAALAYVIYRNRHVFARGDVDDANDSAKGMQELMGMEITPESLPDDVVAVAREAWQRGDYQLALSYLYRGAIVWMVQRADLPIMEGDTEADCLRHVRTMSDQSLSSYFSELTDSWVGVAYGRKKPDDHAMARLCDAWPFGKRGRSEP